MEETQKQLEEEEIEKEHQISQSCLATDSQEPNTRMNYQPTHPHHNNFCTIAIIVKGFRRWHEILNKGIVMWFKILPPKGSGLRIVVDAKIIHLNFKTAILRKFWLCLIYALSSFAMSFIFINITIPSALLCNKSRHLRYQNTNLPSSSNTIIITAKP